MTEERIQQLINNYITHAEKYIRQNQKEFSSFNSLYQKFIKKNNSDPAFEYAKEMVKRMEKDRVSHQNALEISEALMPKIKEIRKKVLIVVVPMILGLILFIACLILLGFTKPFASSNPFVIIYLTLSVTGVLAFIAGMFFRGKVKLFTLSNMMLFQAATAYGAAKMQGQGSFAALRILDEMKANPNKELQIRVNKPKIIYK